MANDLEKLVVGFSYSMVATVVSAVFSYLGGLVVMRLLGPEQYGLYQLVLMFPLLLTPILSFGLDITLVRIIPGLLVSEKERAKDLTKTIFLARLGISLVASLVFLLASRYISKILAEPVTVGLWVASALLVTNALFVFLQAVFQAYFLMRQRAILITLYSTLYLGSVITLILMGLDYVAPLPR